MARNGKLQYLFQKLFQPFSNEHNRNKLSLLTKCAYMALNQSQSYEKFVVRSSVHINCTYFSYKQQVCK